MEQLEQEYRNSINRRINYFNSFILNKTTLEDTIPFIEEYRGACVLTFNIFDANGLLVMNTTVTFAHLKENEFNPELFLVERGGNMVFSFSKSSAEHYILTNLDPNAIHLTFTYR